MEHIFTFKVIVTLTFDLVISKSSTSDKLLKCKHKDLITSRFKDNEWKPFWQLRSRDLDLCYKDVISDRGHLLVITNQYVKYNDLVINSF
jgi:hypothetical protein